MCIELKLRRLDRGKVTGFATATAKSLQSCPTLCSPIPGILQVVAKALRMDELIQRTDWGQKQDPEEATLTFKAWVK